MIVVPVIAGDQPLLKMPPPLAAVLLAIVVSVIDGDEALL